MGWYVSEVQLPETELADSYIKFVFNKITIDRF